MPQYLVIFLPFVVSALNGLFTDFKFPQWVNTVISMIVILGSALAWALLAQKLVSDPIADFVLIAGFSSALVAGPLKPLEQYLKINITSPLKLFASSSSSQAALAAPTIPRASSLQPGQSWSAATQTEPIPEQPTQPTPVPSEQPAQPTQPTPLETSPAAAASDSSTITASSK